MGLPEHVQRDPSDLEIARLGAMVPPAEVNPRILAVLLRIEERIEAIEAGPSPLDGLPAVLERLVGALDRLEVKATQAQPTQPPKSR